MKPMVAELVVNEEVTTFFFVSEPPIVKVSKKKTKYLCLKLQDKTGVIDGRVWDYPPKFDRTTIKKGSFIKVRGQVGEWNEQLQLNVEAIRLADEPDNIDLGDFFERSERDPEAMFQDLYNLLEVTMVYGPVKNLVFAVIYNNKEKLLQAPAAKGVHHGYLGGLLEHTLSMAQVSVPICRHYGLDTDLILAACVLHDIGKIHELTYPVGIGYSLEGTLLGHISIGMDMVSKEIAEVEDFPQDKRMALLHLVASHHGLLEYGSPKIPLMREAIVFHLIDMLDSRNGICVKAMKKGVDEVGLTEWVKELGGPLYVGPQGKSDGE